MATKPTVGGSAGTWGTALNAFLDVSLAENGKIDNAALLSSDDDPTEDAQVVCKKYVDDNSGESFNFRSGASDWDYEPSGSAIDSTSWMELDLATDVDSDISGASAVLLNFKYTGEGGGKGVAFRKADESGDPYEQTFVETANITRYNTVVVPVSSAGKIDAKCILSTSARPYIGILGWWK